jgi:multisubunit Na+/H+ antiporter MnhB subunit
MLITAGFIVLAIGIILVALGYTIEPRAVRPGWGCVFLAVVLILIGAVMPRVSMGHDCYQDTTPASV